MIQVRSISWKLEEIFPNFGDLLSNLDSWFEQSDHLHQFYKGRYSGQRYHKGQIGRFTQQDRRSGTKWKSHVARRLFAVHRALVDTCTKFHGMGDSALWLPKNCPPSGGRWTSDVHYAQNNPTGKRCRHFLCPWCYLREFHDLRRIALFKDTSKVVLRSRDHSAKAAGLKNPVNITLFETSSKDPFLLSRACWKVFITRTDEAILSPHEAAGGMLERRDWPEFHRGLKIAYATHEPDKGYILRVGYLHNNPVLEPREISTKADLLPPIHVRRISEYDINAALRLIMPYPVHMLGNATEGQIINAAMKGRKLYSVVNPGRRSTQARRLRRANRPDFEGILQDPANLIAQLPVLSP